MRDGRLGRVLGILALLGGGGSLGCATATPQQAQRAERECFDEARHDGYRRLALVGTPVVVGDSVIAEISARRHGEEFNGSCNYDQRRRHAAVSFRHASGNEDWHVDKARDACRSEAEDRHFQVTNVSDERTHGDHVRLNMDLRRRGNDFFARCFFENGRADLDIDRI